MVLLYNEVSFPPDQAHKVGEAYIEWVKDHPPDPKVDKNLCILVTNNADGDILTIGIGEIGRGQFKKALMLSTEQNLFLAHRIPGLKYNVKPVLSYQEAYKVIGMAAPEVAYVT